MAATILEEGKARASSIEAIGRAIQANPDALKVMLVEMMPGVVSEFAKSVDNINLGDVTVFDSGSGNAIAGAAMSRAKVLSESIGMLESVLGIDLRKLSRSIVGNVASQDDGAVVADSAKAPTSDG
ncbi:MAG: hypothetical protein IID42_04270 [Planctomycetes bacterium]|nr:hypothetical protein [Planctomycetota bacterium]